jgi:phytoene dehydrogenase-like protein
MGACEVLRMNGGKVFVKARVKEILVEGGRAKGVVMEKGGVIKGKIVVSDAGARNTYLKLLSPESLEHVKDKEFLAALKADDEKDLALNKSGLAPSCTLLNLFCGLDDSAANLGVPAGNAWVVPGWDHKSNFEKFSEEGLECELPVTFIGSNSAKDHSYEKRFGKNRGSIMVLAPVEYKWFEKWEKGRVHARGDEYDALKEKWTKALLRKLYQLYPQLEGHITYMDLGTPLSNNHYLGVNKGEVYGLTHSLERTWKHKDALSAQTDIKGLYLTGQDLMSAGVSAALMGGIMTTAAISKWAILSHVHNLV